MCIRILVFALDWNRVDKEDYLLAMERSPIKDVVRSEEHTSELQSQR